MTTNDDPNTERQRRRLEAARVLVGIAVVAAMVAAAGAGFVALKDERDAWLAMRIPLTLGVIFTWAFARIARNIVRLDVSGPHE